jgi:mannosyltransferase OCH1-like enzyme
MIDFYKIIIVIILIYFIIYYILESFFDFENIPKEYGNDIDDILISKDSNGVPKIIHHICPKDFKRWHQKWFYCYESWLRLFPSPEYTHMHWFDDELHKVIDEDFPWFLEVFNSYGENIKRIDMVRPFILYKYGGIYADMDYYVYSNFYDDLAQDKVSICESPYKGNEEITNALMSSPKNSNYWLLVIDECYKHRDTYVLLSTGPQLISKIYKEYPQLVHVLPYPIFNPPPWDAHSEAVKCKHYNTVMW